MQKHLGLEHTQINNRHNIWVAPKMLINSRCQIGIILYQVVLMYDGFNYHSLLKDDHQDYCV